MSFQRVVGFSLYLDNPLAEAQAEIAFDQQCLLIRAYLFTVDFGDGDEFLADLAGIDTFAACKDGPGQVCIDRRDVLRDER